MTERNFILSTFILLFTGISMLHAQGYAENLDINHRTHEQTSSYHAIGSFVFDRSAAAQFFRYGHSLTELKIETGWRMEDDAFVPAEGSGEKKGLFAVKSYLRLDPKSVAFAGADYQNGKKENVCWNSTADYALLYPYILSDSIGGNLNYEQYHFYGGYTRKDGRFCYGVMASYRAAQEYRQTDPRPRNICSDLSFDLSGGYLCGLHVIGVGAGIRIYQQQQDVDFYNDNGANTSELHMTGLGTYYQRYSGTSYTSTRYNGKGYHLSFTFVPQSHQGWFGLTDYEYLKIDRKLAEANMATLTELSIQAISTGIAYRREDKRTDWGVSLNGTYTYRKGTENVMGSGNNSDNLPLLAQTMYYNHHIDMRAEGFVEWKRHSVNWNIHPLSGFYMQNESYVYPKREQRISRFYAGMTTGFTHLHQGWMIDAKAGGFYTANLTSMFNIPFENTDLRIYQMLADSFRRQSDSWTSVLANIRIQKELSLTTAVFITAGYEHCFYRSGLKDNRLQACIGVCF